MATRECHARSLGRRRWLGGAAAVVAIGLAGCGSTNSAAGNTAAGNTAAGNAGAGNAGAGNAAAGNAGAGNAAAGGSAAPSGSAGEVRSAGGGTVCADAGTVDRLTVTRVSAIPGNHPHFSFPATVVVSDAARARTVARALCALQPVPGGAVACPIDLGITYRLDFTADGRSIPAVTIRAGGCEDVSGGGGLSRWSMRTPAFWGTLGKAMGLARPTHTAFIGTMQS